MQARTERFQQLGGDPFDLLIIGGGITGSGAARDAAQRGLRVALVDKRDWAAGTSSRSAKLVHGGLRYLQTFQLGLVRESTGERAVQMRVAPHLVRPLEFLMPVYARDKHGLWFMNMGLWLYDILALFRVPKRHRVYRGKRLLTRQPNLLPDGLKGGIVFYDAATDDARLTLENVLDAAALGATVVSYAKVDKLTRDDAGRISGAEVTDAHSGERVTIRAHLTVNTSGPWADKVLGLTGDRDRPLLRPTKGAHIVLRADRLPVQMAVAMLHPKDNRPLFVVPWGAHVYVGTTDVDFDGDLDALHAGIDDRDNILEAINHYFPEAGITPADIVGSWCGVRPLVAPPGEMSASKVSREHILEEDPPGLLTMTGGKLTTYRLMARELINRAVKILKRSGHLTRKIPSCHTKRRPLPGAEGIGGQHDLDALAERLAERPDISHAVAKHLASTYGCRAEQVVALAQAPDDLSPMCPPLPNVWAEVDHAVLEEHAQTLDDFFARRTQLLLRDPEGCLETLPAVATRMAELLSWEADRTAAEQRLFTAELRAALLCRQ